MEMAFVLLIGLAIGTAVGWFFRAARAKSEVENARLSVGPDLAVLQQRAHAAEAQLEALATRLRDVERQGQASAAQLLEESARRASFEAMAARVPELEKEVAVREGQLSGAQQRILDLTRDGESLTATLESERKGFEQKLALLEDAKKALSDAFSALSADALRSNAEQFLKLAETSLGKFQEGAKGDLAQKEQAIAQLVEPVKAALEKFESKVGALEVARAGAYEGLVQQVGQLLDTGRQLRTETGNLVQALRAPSVRGRWGEIQLRRVIEMAGMLNYCDFWEQKTVEGEEGDLRPDVVVQLPAGKTIVIDAKTPVAHYLDAMAEPDETQRSVKLKAFAQLVRKHIGDLGRKSYWDQFDNTPELVVMFLAGDHFHMAALQEDPSLLEYGVEQRVLVATPVTLIGLLRAVAYGWRQEAIADNAREISALGAELYKRLADMGGHWVDIGRNLTRSVEAYNKAVGTLETRVLVSGRRFKELGAAANAADLPELSVVDAAVREISAPELTSGALRKLSEK